MYESENLDKDEDQKKDHDKSKAKNVGDQENDGTASSHNYDKEKNQCDICLTKLESNCQQGSLQNKKNSNPERAKYCLVIYEQPLMRLRLSKLIYIHY